MSLIYKPNFRTLRRSMTSHTYGNWKRDVTFWRILTVHIRKRIERDCTQRIYSKVSQKLCERDHTHTHTFLCVVLAACLYVIWLTSHFPCHWRRKRPQERSETYVVCFWGDNLCNMFCTSNLRPVCPWRCQSNHSGTTGTYFARVTGMSPAPESVCRDRALFMCWCKYMLATLNKIGSG